MAAQVWRIFSGFPTVEARLNAQVALLDVARRRELRRGAGPHHLSLLDDVVPVRDAGERRDVLVDQQDGEAGGLQAGQAAPDFRAQWLGGYGVVRTCSCGSSR